MIPKPVSYRSAHTKMALPRASNKMSRAKKPKIHSPVSKNASDSESGQCLDNSNAEWASTLSKLLIVKPPRSDVKCAILAVTRSTESKGKFPILKPSFTVVGEDGNPVETHGVVEDLREEKTRMGDRRDWEEMGRVKPDITDRAHEGRLTRIATKGVMHLFNAVQSRQRAIEVKLKAVGTSEFKKEKVLKSMTKGDFLDILKNNTAKVGEADGKPQTRVEPKWKLLHDDFTTGSKMKDWDIKSVSSDSE